MSATSAPTQRLPSHGPAREALRQKGQFWTPAWVAEAMVAYALRDSDELFDPAVGAGAFFRAAKLAHGARGALRLLGTEMDPTALVQARESGLSIADLAQVRVEDFVLSPPRGPFQSIVANPPYIRHHRIAPEVKAQFAAQSITPSPSTIERYSALIRQDMEKWAKVIRAANIKID